MPVPFSPPDILYRYLPDEEYQPRAGLPLLSSLTYSLGRPAFFVRYLPAETAARVFEPVLL